MNAAHSRVSTALHRAILAAISALLIVAVRPIACAAEKPEYLQSFNPEQGFKPAQADLTEVFLQLAGSLEYYGTPEPYLRHVRAEHARIEAKYKERFGTAPKSFCPAYMTDEYLDRLSANWNTLSPKLGLDALTKHTGNLMRDAINGTRGTGTTVVEILNHHQALVYTSMSGKAGGSTDYEALKRELIRGLEIEKTTINDRNYDLAHRDAVGFTVGIRGPIIELFAKLDASLKPADSERFKGAIVSMFNDVGRMAQSELEVGIAERALDRQTAAQ